MGVSKGVARVADDLLHVCVWKASNAPEHLKRVSACNICEFLDEKRNALKKR